MGEVIQKAAWVYLLTIVVSMAVAGLIRLMVVVSARFSRPAVAVAAPSPAATAQAGVPEEDVAAIAAALAAVLGAHRIVHIAEAGRARAWTAEGRALLHSRHSPHHPQR